MRKFLVLAVLLPGVCLVSWGQNLRTVKGRVVDEDGSPMAGVAVMAQNGEGKTESDAQGNFTVQVPYSCRQVTAAKLDFVPATAEIDGSFLILKLKYDFDGVKRREAAAEAQAKADAEAAAKAERDSLAALEKARREAEAQAKADADAAAKAERDSLAALEKARREAEARAKADAEAAAKAERDSLAALEKARREAEAQAKADADAAAKAERKARTAELDSKYDGRFKNRGLSHSIEAGYAYEIVSPQQIFYLYSGEREYGNLHPLQFTYTLSWKFNRWVSLGVGAGALFNAKSLEIVNDEFYGEYSGFREHRVDVPVFLNLRTTFCRTAVRPYVSLTGGFYCLSKQVMAEGGIGCEFRFARICGIRVQASANLVPWPDLNAGGGACYSSLIAPGVKIGFDF